MRTVVKPQRQWTRPLKRLESGRSTISLTFDDGPDPKYTPRLLDLLADANVKATFFVLASEAIKHPRLIRRMVSDGHTVASHGWCHRHPWLQSSTSARNQVILANLLLTLMIGEQPKWFRPPHGSLRFCMTQAVSEAGQRIALWSKSAVDWGPWATPQRVMRRLLTVSDGDIVLLHDGRNRHNRPDITLQVLPEWLASLADRKLQPVELAQERWGEANFPVRRQPSPNTD